MILLSYFKVKKRTHWIAAFFGIIAAGAIFFSPAQRTIASRPLKYKNWIHPENRKEVITHLHNIQNLLEGANTRKILVETNALYDMIQEYSDELKMAQLYESVLGEWRLLNTLALRSKEAQSQKEIKNEIDRLLPYFKEEPLN